MKHSVWIIALATACAVPGASSNSSSIDGKGDTAQLGAAIERPMKIVQAIGAEYPRAASIEQGQLFAMSLNHSGINQVGALARQWSSWLCVDDADCEISDNASDKIEMVSRLERKAGPRTLHRELHTFETAHLSPGTHYIRYTEINSNGGINADAAKRLELTVLPARDEVVVGMNAAQEPMGLDSAVRAAVSVERGVPLVVSLHQPDWTATGDAKWKIDITVDTDDDAMYAALPTLQDPQTDINDCKKGNKLVAWGCNNRVGYTGPISLHEAANESTFIGREFIWDTSQLAEGEYRVGFTNTVNENTLSLRLTVTNSKRGAAYRSDGSDPQAAYVDTLYSYFSLNNGGLVKTRLRPEIGATVIASYEIPADWDRNEPYYRFDVLRENTNDTVEGLTLVGAFNPMDDNIVEGETARQLYRFTAQEPGSYELRVLRAEDENGTNSYRLPITVHEQDINRAWITATDADQPVQIQQGNDFTIVLETGDIWTNVSNANLDTPFFTWTHDEHYERAATTFTWSTARKEVGERYEIVLQRTLDTLRNDDSYENKTFIIEVTPRSSSSDGVDG